MHFIGVLPFTAMLERNVFFPVLFLLLSTSLTPFANVVCIRILFGSIKIAANIMLVSISIHLFLFFHFFRLIMTNLEMHFLSSFDRRRRRSLCALTSAFNVIFSLTSQCSIAFEIEAKVNPQFHNKSWRHLLDVCSGWLWDGTGIERALKLFSSVVACLLLSMLMQMHFVFIPA